MSNRIAVVVDTNSGISEKRAKELGIYVISMPFIIDGKEYFEGVDLTDELFYEKLVSNSDIHTSQPSIGSVIEMYDKVLKNYDYIIHIPMSSSLSKTYETASMISHQDEYEGKVFVVDNKRISVTIEYSVYEAIEMIKNGKNAKEIKDFLEETSADSSIYLMVDTLKYLKKGGRVTPAAALLGSLLGIKPILQIQGGKLDAFDKCRTVKKAKDVMVSQIKKDIENRFGKDVVINVVHIFAKDQIETFKKEVEEIFPDYKIDMNSVSFSIACHTGPGVIAITCCKKHDLK